MPTSLQLKHGLFEAMHREYLRLPTFENRARYERALGELLLDIQQHRNELEAIASNARSLFFNDTTLNRPPTQRTFG